MAGSSLTSFPDPVPYDAPVVERGTGFFETVLLAGRRAVLWAPHLDRLLGTLARFELPAPKRASIDARASDAVDSAVFSGDESERALRVSWIAIGADLDSLSSWRLDVSLRSIPESTLSRRSGSRVVTLPSELRRDTPSVKSTSYFAAIAGLRLARRRGGDEGLFAREDGTFLEGTSTALAAWNGGAWLVSDGPFLPSVTAAAFLDGRERRRPLTSDLVRGGALLLGSLTKATPVVSLDAMPCEVPAAMLEEASAFNGRLLADASIGRLL